MEQWINAWMEVLVVGGVLTRSVMCSGTNDPVYEQQDSGNAYFHIIRCMTMHMWLSKKCMILLYVYWDFMKMKKEQPKKINTLRAEQSGHHFTGGNLIEI